MPVVEPTLTPTNSILYIVDDTLRLTYVDGLTLKLLPNIVDPIDKDLLNDV